MRKKRFGLIYLSSYKIQLYIVDLSDMSQIEQVDSPSLLQTSSKFGTYESGLAQISEILHGFRRKLAEYKIRNYKVFGNRQLLGQLKAHYLKDQIRVRTGFELTWLNGSQVAYNKVIAGINAFPALPQKKETEITYLLSLGSSMMNLSLFKGARFVSTWSIALGPEELDEIVEITSEAAIEPIEVMTDYVTSKLEHLRQQLVQSEDTTFIIQHSQLLNQYLLQRKASVSPITKADFDQIYHEVVTMPNQFIEEKYALDQMALTQAMPKLVMMHQLRHLTHAKHLFVTDQSVITGLLIQEAVVQGFIKTDFTDIMLTSAQNMAKRYLVDGKHTKAVTKFALHIFDQMKRFHLFSIRERRLLEIACMVNDIGNFIDPHRRHQHTGYILEANQLIGLSDRENEIIAETARFQSGHESNEEAQHYRSLDPQVQMMVAKLASIARLASALDASHRQKIQRIMVSLKDDRMILTAISPQDLTLERWAIKQQETLFEEVFGIRVVLKQKKRGNLK